MYKSGSGSPKALMRRGNRRAACVGSRSPSGNVYRISPEAVDLGRAIEPLIADRRLGWLSGRPIQRSILEAVRLGLLEFSVLHNDLTTLRMIVHDREHRLNVARLRAFRPGRLVSLQDVKLACCHLVALARIRFSVERARASDTAPAKTPAGRGPSSAGVAGG